MSAPNQLAGITRDQCATACNRDGCVISGKPHCAHPMKGGLPIQLLNDRPIQEAFDNACTALGIKNIYKTETAS
jgi:hypothetical protein